MIGTLMPWVDEAFTDFDGNPLSGGRLFFYQAGSSIPLQVYSDSGLTTPRTQPLVLDASGRPPTTAVFFSAATYKIVVESVGGVQIRAIDNVAAYAPASEVATLQAAVLALQATGVDPGICEGRISLSSTEAVAPDLSAQTSVYYVPYLGNRIALWDGAGWVLRTFGVLGLGLGSDAANTPWSLFASWNGSAVILERFAHATGADMLSTLTKQDGILVQVGAFQRRFLGAYRTRNGMGEVTDNGQERLVANFYNRVRKELRFTEGASTTWNYTLATFRPANNNSGNRVVIMSCYGDQYLDLELVAIAQNTNVNVLASVAIGENNLTTPAGPTGLIQSACTQVANLPTVARTTLRKRPLIGPNEYNWLEKSQAVGTTTWTGQSADFQSGIFGSIDC